MCFIRTSRPENNIIYNCNEDFHVGQAKVCVRFLFAYYTSLTSLCLYFFTSTYKYISSLPTQVVYKTNDDHVTVVGAGVTLHEALAAAEQLKKGTETQNKRDGKKIKPAHDSI